MAYIYPSSAEVHDQWGSGVYVVPVYEEVHDTWSPPPASSWSSNLGLTHLGEPIVPISVGLSIDQDSPVWMADIVLSDVAAYQVIDLGDTLSLTVNGTDYTLICDGKSLSRSDVMPTLTIKAISPVALAGTAFAAPITLGASGPLGMAHATVSALLAPLTVSWSIVDWLLPTTAASLEATPLDLARQIVAAAGGLLESASDGSIIVRPAYPVDVPDFADSQSSAVALNDSHLLSVQDSIDASPRYDRWIIIGEEFIGAQMSLQLASEPVDADDPSTQRIRAWPWPWRTISLVHTGDSNTMLTAIGAVTEEYTELVEIQSGSGSVAHPVLALISATYQHVDLGNLASDGTAITSTIADYSLVWITYTSSTWQWTAHNAVPETIQFLAME